jgi:hypothetical protein
MESKINKTRHLDLKEKRDSSSSRSWEGKLQQGAGISGASQSYHCRASTSSKPTGEEGKGHLVSQAGGPPLEKKNLSGCARRTHKKLKVEQPKKVVGAIRTGNMKHLTIIMTFWHTQAGRKFDRKIQEAKVKGQSYYRMC